MDIRTATQLYLCDLASLIAIGNFRCIGAAEDVVAEALRSAPDETFSMRDAWQAVERVG